MVEERKLLPGDRVVIYSDGVTEAQSPAREFFGRKRLRDIVMAHTTDSCIDLHNNIMGEVKGFINTAPQADDITTVILEYRPEE